MLNKQRIVNEITEFVSFEGRAGILPNSWGKPLIGLAYAHEPGFMKLREIAHPEHVMPWEVIADAETVICYFLPLSEKIGNGNGREGLASAEWAQVYEVTNAMIGRLNKYLIEILRNNGYTAAVPAEALVFDRINITSRWSQRHAARIAGLGTFGLNNMLITDAGCCGRFGSVITNMELECDKPAEEEYCLYKKNGSCGVCVKKCRIGALKKEGYDRYKCFEQCLLNADVHKGYGGSYTSKAGGEMDDSGSEVCGKCLIGLPCTYKRP